MPSPLPYGPLGETALHLCVDMQTMFAERTEWQVPWMHRVLPAVLQVARARAEQTVFTRFVPPDRPEQVPGSWHRYYQRWPQMTRERLDPALIALVPPLAELVPPATVLDKQHYSPFSEPALPRLLAEHGIDSLVVTGAETDVCVLATVLAAVDQGFRVILASDALCSVSDRTHDALMTLYQERFGQQIETAPVAAILEAWPE